MLSLSRSAVALTLARRAHAGVVGTASWGGSFARTVPAVLPRLPSNAAAPALVATSARMVSSLPSRPGALAVVRGAFASTSARAAVGGPAGASSWAFGAVARRFMVNNPSIPPSLRPKQNAGKNKPPSGAGSAESVADSNKRLGVYAAAVIIGVLGVSYAAVPLYQMFCQATGYGGTIQTATEEQFKNVRPVVGAPPITVYFNADTSDVMPWTFTPLQRSVKVVPGETALAFYRAENHTNENVTGVSTYNVTPMRAGVHFHKIQCFCFEEQRLGPREEIDMPLFFYIDPDWVDDPAMRNVRSVTLSYTFFRTGKHSFAASVQATPGP